MEGDSSSLLEMMWRNIKLNKQRIFESLEAREIARYYPTLIPP